jgi:hypothetical protein
MVDKANVDTSPVEIEWIPGKNMNWIVDNVRMGRKCGLFALEFRGHTRDEAEWLLHANKLCADVEETTKMIREACKQIDEEWKTWLSERRRIYAKSPAV